MKVNKAILIKVIPEKLFSFEGFMIINSLCWSGTKSATFSELFSHFLKNFKSFQGACHPPVFSHFIFCLKHPSIMFANI